jgi:hypothetical protein
MKTWHSNTDRMIAGVLVYLALWYLMPKAPPVFASAVLQPWKRSA